MSHHAPPARPGLPFLGNLPEIARSNILHIIEDSWPRLGDAFSLKMLGQTLHVLCHPDHAEHVLFTHKDRYIKGVGYDTFRLLAGQGLVTLEEGEAWKRARRMASPPFLKSRVGRHAPAMQEAAALLAQRWRGLPAGTMVDLGEEMARFAMEVILRTVMPMATAADMMHIHKVMVAALAFTSRRGNSIPLPLWLPLPDHQRWKADKAELDRFFLDAILAARADGRGAEASLLHALVHATEPDGSRLSDEMVRDHVLTIFLAGYETTARTLSWAFWLMATQPEAAGPMLAELRALGEDAPAADPFSLVETGRYIDEVLRLYTPTWAVVRQAAADDEIAGYHIGAGDQIMVAIHLIHRHPAFWADPLDFRPARFAGGPPAHRCAFIPFSAGSRVCLGNHFATQEMVIALAALAPHFRFTAEDPAPLGVKAEVLLVPTRPMRVGVAPV